MGLCSNNVLESYLGCAWFKFWPGHQLSYMGFHAFPYPL
jgi:hypothetical protein